MIDVLKILYQEILPQLDVELFNGSFSSDLYIKSILPFYWNDFV